MSSIIRIAMAGALSLGLAGAASAQAPELLKPRQLVSQFTCSDAEALEKSMGKVAAISTDGRRELEIVWSMCAAQEHNQAHPDQPEVVLVAPAASAPATQNKTYATTVRVNDAEGVRDFCEKAGGQVATDGAPVSCESFVRGAKASLIVLAPASVGGVAVTTHVLSVIGAGNPDGHLQYEVDRVAKETRGSAAANTQATLDHPILQVAFNQGAGTLSGRGGQLTHVSKCLVTMGFGNGCPNR